MYDAAFLKGETWDLPGEPVEHVETHAAHVFLAGNRAFKIKKSVKLPYLDFSLKAKREAVIRDEFEINRAYAPDIYLGVREVKDEPVLVMRRFPSRALLSWTMSHGGIGADLAVRLAESVASAHAIAARRETGGASIMMGLGAQLSKAFIDSPDIFRPAETLEFHALCEEALKRCKPLLNERGEQGLVRRCHGDMHAGNIIVEDGMPKLFDAIEFSEAIATIDVLYDLAFLLMDLWCHGEKRAANVILNRYMHLRRSQENLSGLALLPLFLSTRAGVRALVSADLAHELSFSGSMKPRGQALDWFRASIAFLKPASPELICIGGLSGTGKSTLAAALAPETGAPAGAIHIRSDVERKVLGGVGETERLPPESYSREASVAAYSACFTRASKALAAGHSVVLDAVFAHESERQVAASIAQHTGARFHGLWLDAQPDVLKARVSARKADASDATAAVIDKQLNYDLGRLNWGRVNAGGTPEETLEAVRQTLRYQPAARA